MAVLLELVSPTRQVPLLSLAPSTTRCLSYTVLLALKKSQPFLSFPSLQPQAFWGRAAWGQVDVGTLCGLQAVLQGVKQRVLCLENISSN